MKKVFIIIGTILFISLVVAVAFYGYNRLKNKNNSPQTNQVQADSTASSEESKVQKRAGTYEVYDVSKLSQASDGKVVLFFNAKWSKTSKQLDQELKNNTSKLPSNFTVLSVDYDKNYTLRKKYNVPFENTFVQVDANGEIINSWSGSEDMAEIIALAK